MRTLLFSVANILQSITRHDMTKTMSLKQARSRFSALVDKADPLSEQFIVTKNGTPKAVVMGVEEFES